MLIVSIADNNVELKIDKTMADLRGNDQTEAVMKDAKLSYLHITHPKNSALQCRICFQVPTYINPALFSDSQISIEYKNNNQIVKLPLFFITNLNYSVDKTHDTPGISSPSYVVAMVAQNYIFHLLSTKLVSSLTSSRTTQGNADIQSIEMAFCKDIRDFVIPPQIAEKRFGGVEILDKMFANMYANLRFHPSGVLIQNTYYSYMLNLLRSYQLSARTDSMYYQSVKNFPQVYYNFYIDDSLKLHICVCESGCDENAQSALTPFSAFEGKSSLGSVAYKLSGNAIIKTYTSFADDADNFDAFVSAFDEIAHKKTMNLSTKINYSQLLDMPKSSNASADSGKKSGGNKKGALSRSVINLGKKKQDTNEIDCPVTAYGLSATQEDGKCKLKFALGVDRAYMEDVEEIGYDFSRR